MSITGNIAGVIFDMDGCLVDTETVYKFAWRKAFEKYSVKIPMEQIDSWVGLGWDIIAEQINQITENSKLTLDIRETREAIFFQMLSEGVVHLMPGALEILQYAKDQHLVVGLASSTFKEKGMRILSYFKLLEYFDFIVFGDEVERRKPYGDIYVKAIEKSGLTTTQLLAFEDSIIGCQAAEAACLQTIWIPAKGLDSLVKNHPETICEIIPTLENGKILLQDCLED